MHITRQSLIELYSSLSDAELSDRCASGELTELAREVAAAEMARRGLTPPEAVDASPSAIDEPAIDDTPISMTTIRRYVDPTLAKIHCGLLNAEGIPAFLADANLVQMHSLLIPAVGGIRLQVPAVYADAARQILAEADTGMRALDSESIDSDGFAVEDAAAGPAVTRAGLYGARLAILALAVLLLLFLMEG